MIDKDLILQNVIATERKHFPAFFDSPTPGKHYDREGRNLLCKYVICAKPINALAVRLILSLEGTDVNHTD